MYNVHCTYMQPIDQTSGSDKNALHSFFLRALEEVASHKVKVVFLSEIAVVKDSSRHNVRAAPTLRLGDVGHLLAGKFYSSIIKIAIPSQIAA